MLRDKINKLDASYGLISREDYDQLQKQIKVIKERELEPTLREDFFFELNDGGNLDISYHAHCSTCGLDFRYNERFNILEKETNNHV